MPREGSDRGNCRRFEDKRWDSPDTPAPIKKVATIMVDQLNKRFKLNGIPDINTLLAIKLNPTVDKEMVFNNTQREAMNAAYDVAFNKAADYHFQKRQEAAEDAADTVRANGSPSPAKAPAAAAGPLRNATGGNIINDAADAFTFNLSDDAPSGVSAADGPSGPLVDDRSVEKANFATFGKNEMRLGVHRGKFSSIRLYANEHIKAKYPIHVLMAKMVFGCVQNEADCERVFSFSGSSALPSALRLLCAAC